MNMKTIFVLSLVCLLFGSTLAARTAYISKYFRSSQSCAKSGGYGWFWDEQKCERCRNDWCTCTEYYGCDLCAPGWQRISTANPSGDFSKPGKCVKCPSFAENDKTYGVSETGTRTIFQNYFKMWREKEYTSYTDDLAGATTLNEDTYEDPDGIYTYGDVKECCNPFNNEAIYWDGYEEIYRFGLRAKSCRADTGIIKYQLTGSVCWYIKGCKEYTTGYDTPLRCAACYDGFYLDENQECTQCNSTPFVDTKQTDGKTHCIKCSGPQQCDTCEDGYFMGKNQYRLVIDDTETNQARKVQQYASYCIQCPKKHCICNLISPTSDTDNENSYNYLGPVSDYYYYSSSESSCKACDEYTGMSTCLRCTYDASKTTDKYTCKECKKFMGTTELTFYTSNTQGGCIACPSNCTACSAVEQDSTIVTSCNNGKCFNGYRWYLDNSLGKCKKCEKDMAGRCETDSDEEVITQCKTESNTSTGTEYLLNVEGGYQNRLPPNTGDYYLMTSDNKKVCVKNEKSCREMENAQGSCKNCYTEDDWYLVENVDGTSIKWCAQCSAQQANCATCVSAPEPSVETIKSLLDCSVCNNGRNKSKYGGDVKNYYLSPRTGYTSQGTCKECPEGCLTCSLVESKLTCESSSCQYGYSHDAESNVCQICTVSNCKTCPNDNQDFCSECFPNYRLWVDVDADDREVRGLQVCEACEVGCAVCTTTRKKCTQCQTGYYLWSDTCHVMKANCIIHEGSDTQGPACRICAYGYRLVDRRCMACLSLRGSQYHCHTQCQLTTKSLPVYTSNVDLNADRSGPNTKSRLLEELSDF